MVFKKSICYSDRVFVPEITKKETEKLKKDFPRIVTRKSDEKRLYF